MDGAFAFQKGGQRVEMAKNLRNIVLPSRGRQKQLQKHKKNDFRQNTERRGKKIPPPFKNLSH